MQRMRVAKYVTHISFDPIDIKMIINTLEDPMNINKQYHK